MATLTREHIFRESCTFYTLKIFKPSFSNSQQKPPNLPLFLTTFSTHPIPSLWLQQLLSQSIKPLPLNAGHHQNLSNWSVDLTTGHGHIKLECTWPSVVCGNILTTISNATNTNGSSVCLFLPLSLVIICCHFRSVPYPPLLRRQPRPRLAKSGGVYGMALFVCWDVTMKNPSASMVPIACVFVHE